MSEQEIISKSSLSTADGKMTDPTFAEFIKRIRNLDYKRKDELLRLVKRRLAVQTLEEGARRAEIQGKLNRGSVKAAKSTSTASQHENNRLPAARTLYPGGVEQFETDFEEPVCFRAVEAVMETFYHFCIRLSHEENSSIMPESEVTDSTYSKYVLFPRVGMLNHSCRPNAEASFNSQSRMMIVRAITQIECGDEITIAYQNPFKARLQRWECLGFECYCEYCSLRGYKSKILDERLEHIDRTFRLISVFQREHFGRYFVHEQDISASVSKSILLADGTGAVWDCVVDMMENITKTGIASSIATIPLDIQCIIIEAVD